VAGFGHEAAVLLDERGRLLRSAARRRPVVAFAVPYQTPHGRWVFSGAYEIAGTPLAGYLGDAIPTASSVLYLVDTSRVVAASNRPPSDGLVGLGSQDPVLAAALDRRPGTTRSGCPKATCAIMDLDHFKRHNDTYGHQGGDRLLKETAAAWRNTVRSTDLLARYGGEEFALLAPACPLEGGRDRYVIA
jgi:Diguanylate cyclase, GGDEF domain